MPKRVLPAYENDDVGRRIDNQIHSKRNRQILYLKLIDGESFFSIAEIMDMPVSTVTDAYYKDITTIFPGS